MPEEIIQALRNTNALSDPKLNALAQFTLAVIDLKGQVSDDELKDFLAAGYTQANALEVVLGVSLATLCHYANNLAKTPINPERQAYASNRRTDMSQTDTRTSLLDAVADQAKAELAHLVPDIDQ